MNDIRLGNIMEDCNDEQILCDFYHKLLGWERTTLFGRPALRSENGIVFLFIEEEGYVPPVWPEEANQQQKQLHFDFTVPDVPSAVTHAQELGAVLPADQFGGKEFVTLIDPAGHPFCLCDENNSAN